MSFQGIYRKWNFFLSLPMTIKSLLVHSMIVAFGSFMVTPFLGIFLKQSLHLDPSWIGVILAMSTLVQFGGSLPGAMIAERIGFKNTMLIALSMRIVGFILLSLSVQWRLFVVPASFLIAAASALYLPANRAYVVQIVTKDLHSLFLSLSNSALNAGMAAGPLLSALFIRSQPQFLFYGASFLFLILIATHALTLQNLPRTGQKTSFGELPIAFKKASGFFSINMQTFFLYFFFQSFIGLTITQRFSEKVFSYVILINLIILFLVQPIFHKQINNFDYKKVLICGYTLLAIGFGCFQSSSLIGYTIGTVVMSVGQSILFLRGDLEIIQALPQQSALAFGLQRLATGTGGFLSGLIGGFLYSHYLNSFWSTVAIFAALAVVGSHFFGSKIKMSFKSGSIPEVITK